MRCYKVSEASQRREELNITDVFLIADTKSDTFLIADVEIKEAFSVLDLADKGTTSAKELRAVMLACCEMEVKFQDGKKMIQAASSVESKDKSVINFEEFKSILYWRPPEDFDFDPVGGHPVAQGVWLL